MMGFPVWLCCLAHIGITIAIAVVDSHSSYSCCGWFVILACVMGRDVAGGSSININNVNMSSIKTIANITSAIKTTADTMSFPPPHYPHVHPLSPLFAHMCKVLLLLLRALDKNSVVVAVADVVFRDCYCHNCSCLGHSCPSFSMPGLPLPLPILRSGCSCCWCGVPVALREKDIMVTKMPAEDASTLFMLIEDCWGAKQT